MRPRNHSTFMERSPKLTTAQLSRDHRIHHDGLLRGSSANEVAGAIRAWLSEHHPGQTGFTLTLAADENSVARVEARWRRQCRKNNYPELIAKIDRTDRAITMFGEIVLLPQVMTELGTRDVFTRAMGARSLIHEWWHVTRQERTRFYPFEEGSAEVFADATCQQAFGFHPPKDWRYYGALAQGIEQVGEALGDSTWYLPSRSEPDVSEWLRLILLNSGFSPESVAEVLLSERNDDVWLSRVQRMIATQNHDPV
jgi:hypothetical protein